MSSSTSGSANGATGRSGFSRRALLIGGAAAGITASLASQSPAANATVPECNVGTFNVKYSLSDAQAWEDYAKFLPYVAIGGFNEVGKRKIFRQNLRDLGYYMVQSDPKAGIMFADPNHFEWREGFTHGSFAMPVPEPKKGEARQKKYISYNSYFHRATGTPVMHFHNHVVPGWAPTGQPDHSREQTPFALEHLRQLRDHVNWWSRTHAVIVTGDLNIDYSKDRAHKANGAAFNRLEKETSLTSIWSQRGERPTHVSEDGTKSTLDYLYTTPQFKFLTEPAIVKGNSDHHGVIATLHW